MWFFLDVIIAGSCRYTPQPITTLIFKSGRQFDRYKCIPFANWYYALRFVPPDLRKKNPKFLDKIKLTCKSYKQPQRIYAKNHIEENNQKMRLACPKQWKSEGWCSCHPVVKRILNCLVTLRFHSLGI